MDLIFDSRNQFFKSPFGCVKQGEELSFFVLCEQSGAEIFLLLEKDGEKEISYAMQPYTKKGGFTGFRFIFSSLDCGLYFYRFCVKCGEKTVFFGRACDNTPSSISQERWQLLCYDDRKLPPESFSGTVYYQIFPDRFFEGEMACLSGKLAPFWVHEKKSDTPHYLPDEHGEIKNNDFYGGNLSGITEKLDVLSELGVGVIYLNPIFMAFSNHRYDTADYHRIDPMLGTEEDFKRLCEEAHRRGMKVILDGVFSHTGDRSVYFDRCGEFGMGAAVREDSPYRSWYRFYHYPHDYESWWGIKTLPCVEEIEPSYQEFVVTGEDSVIRHWLRAGADGFRLDVADELPDSFLECLYRTVKEEKPEAVVIGEVWEDASNKISYGMRRKYLWGQELDGVMNYVYRGAIIDFITRKTKAEDFMEQVVRLSEHYPAQHLNCSMTLLSTHDTIRIMTLLSGEDSSLLSREERAHKRLSQEQYKKGRKLLSAAVFLQFTLPGSPSIYYGDEIGMQGYEDPFNRRFYEWETQDVEIREEYRRLSVLKRRLPALRKGRICSVWAAGGLVVFSRICEEEELFCAVNVSEKPEEIRIGETEPVFSLRCMEGNGSITLLPYGAMIW